MQRLVMMAVGLSAAFASAAPGRALIWGGGPTRDSAAAARTALDTSDVNAMLAFAPGFPKSIESRAVKGLKPGLHIVLLGLCSERDDATLALAVARSVEPGVYVRRIEFEGSGSCPVLKAPWTQVAATGERTRLDIKVISDKRTLRVLAWLKDDGGDVLDFASQASTCAIECKNVRTLMDEREATVAFTLVVPSCTVTGEMDLEWQITATRKRLSIREVNGEQRYGSCD